MMKHFDKIRACTALLLSLILFAGLVACNPETKKENSSKNSSSRVDTSSAPDTDPDELFKNPKPGGTSSIPPFDDDSRDKTSTAGGTGTAGSKTIKGGLTHKDIKGSSNPSGGGSKPKKLYGKTGDTSFSIPVTGLQKNTIYSVDKAALQSFPGTKIMAHDLLRLFVSVQGLINRDVMKNRIALVQTPIENYDSFWLNYISAPNTVMHGMKTVRITTFEEFLNTFKDVFKACGIVLWDPNVPATSNLAATICGLDGHLPVKYDRSSNGLQAKLEALGVPVKLSLVNRFSGKGIIPGTKIASSGSSKCDAYLWAVEKYMHRTSTKYMAYLADGASCVESNIIYKNDTCSRDAWGAVALTAHDYAIARRMFFYDLSPVGSEPPCDDLDQPYGTDLRTYEKILLTRYENANGEFGQINGYVPWQIKYTTHNGWGSIVDTAVEAMYVSLVTKYNNYVDVGFNLINSSAYYQYPLKKSYSNGSKAVTETYNPNTVYLYFHIGDYDASAWVVEHMWKAYEDPLRGTFPITWAINPGMSDRIPMAFDYFYTNKKPNDTFSASDSGVCYFRPEQLFPNDWEVDGRSLPAGDAEMIKATEPYFKKFDVDIVSFIIGNMSTDAYKMYNKIAPKGSFHLNNAIPTLYNGVPYIPTMNGIGNPGTYPATAQRMWEFIRTGMRRPTGGGAVNFAAFRTITWTPTQLKAVMDAFQAIAAQKDPGRTYKFVNAYTLLEMAKQSGQMTVVND